MGHIPGRWLGVQIMQLGLPSLHSHIMSHTPREGFSEAAFFQSLCAARGESRKQRQNLKKKKKNEGTQLFIPPLASYRENENQLMWKTIKCTSHRTQRNIYWLLPIARGDGRSTGGG